MTTKEAFVKLISERGVYKRLGVTKGYIGFVKDQIKKEEPKYPSIDTMEKMLEKAGFKVVQEKEWEEDEQITIPEMKAAIRRAINDGTLKILKKKS